MSRGNKSPPGVCLPAEHPPFWGWVGAFPLLWHGSLPAVANRHERTQELCGGVHVLRFEVGGILRRSSQS